MNEISGIQREKYC